MPRDRSSDVNAACRSLRAYGPDDGSSPHRCRLDSRAFPEATVEMELAPRWSACNDVASLAEGQHI